MKGLTLLENEVLRALLDGEDTALATLREQLGLLDVASRRMTGAGFFTDFAVSPAARRLPNPAPLKLGDVNATAAGVARGLGFLLYIDDGALSRLEGYTYDEPWPARLASLKLSYATG